MRLRTPGCAVTHLVFKELGKIQLDERGKAFHAMPSGEGNLVVTDAPIAQEYPETGVLVVSSRPLQVSGGEGTAFFGIRVWTPKEHVRIERASRLFTMREISRDGLHDLTDAVMSRSRGWQKVHLILDLSVVDPVFLGVEGSPGGLTSREFLYVVQRLAMLRHLATAEVIVPEGRMAVRLAAKAVAELL